MKKVFKQVFWCVSFLAWAPWQLQFWLKGRWNIYGTFNQKILLQPDAPDCNMYVVLEIPKAPPQIWISFLACRSDSSSNACKAPLTERETCNPERCPVYTEWSEWSECSRTCGGGTQALMKSLYNVLYDQSLAKSIKLIHFLVVVQLICRQTGTKISWTTVWKSTNLRLLPVTVYDGLQINYNRTLPSLGQREGMPANRHLPELEVRRGVQGAEVRHFWSYAKFVKIIFQHFSLLCLQVFTTL